MEEKDLTPQEQNLWNAARLIKRHCEKNNFYETGDVCRCVFAKEGETCPFDTGSSLPADWEV